MMASNSSPSSVLIPPIAGISGKCTVDNVLLIRLRLRGTHGYEAPIVKPLECALPHIGDVIEVLVDDRAIKARVTETTPPICRAGRLAYVAFASEVDASDGAV
jgi:hypothetical protein